MRFLEEVKKWLGEITEIALLLIALGIVIEILFGSPETAVPFFGQVIPNLTGLLEHLGDNGLAGLIVLGILVVLFQRKKPASYPQN